MSSEVTLDDLRRYSVARTLFAPTDLYRAIETLGFVQADPIRAPARAQDLTLRHRVKGYRVGDLERRYKDFPIEEDFFINYGFLPRTYQVLMHPRVPRSTWDAATRRRAQAVLDFVRERGDAHPRQVNDHFAHGKVTNYWGGPSNSTTHLLDEMHYRGLLRVTRRDSGVRIYAAHQHAPAPANVAELRQRLDTLVDVIVRKYAPLPSATLTALVSRLRYGAPQLAGKLNGALIRAKKRLAHTRIHSVDWYWPADERPQSFRDAIDDQVRLLAPFDPIVWDRHRFELIWGWRYRFEAYHPAPKRKFGYYAMPLLWHDKVIGWANLRVQDGQLQSTVEYTVRATQRRGLGRELEVELERIRQFLRV